MNGYSGELYIWTLGQTALAAARFPGFEPTWQGIEMLQQRWRDAGEKFRGDAPKDFRWARLALADADARFNVRYEQVPA